jgi:hypothetical protein
MQQINDFVYYNNVSLDDRFLVFQVRDFDVFYEKGTMIVVVSKGIVNRKKETFSLPSCKEALHKALHLIRDKYVEGDRPYLPVRYTQEANYLKFEKADCKETPIIPLFFKNNKLLSLMLRIGKLYPILELLMKTFPMEHIRDENLFAIIEDMIGTGILEGLFAYRSTRLLHVDGRNQQIIPVLGNGVGFFWEERGLEPCHKAGTMFLTKQRPTDMHENLFAFVTEKGVFFYQDAFMHITEEKELFRITIAEWEQSISSGIYFLSDSKLSLPSDYNLSRELITTQQSDEEISSLKLTLRTVKFRKPVSCKAIPKDKLELIPKKTFYVQPKLDGNRLCVYIEPNPLRCYYFSRTGKQQPLKFNTHFDEGITELYKKLITNGNQTLFVDCECYAHGVDHQLLSGIYNRKKDDTAFAQFNLHVLSYVVIGTETSFQQVFANLERVFFDEGIFESKRISFNKGCLLNTTDEIKSYMEACIGNNYEGVVLYTPNDIYQFGVDRLFKIKMFYDHECFPLEMVASKEDPSVIGSVKVRCKRFFDDTLDWIELNITASLVKELKECSFGNPIFDACIGKPFTIICDDFSTEGVPQHSRFKEQFSPNGIRLDV